MIPMVGPFDVSSIGHGQIEVISHRRLIASTYISVVALPKLLAIQPSQVHLGWSGSVTISGVNFVSSNELVCSFGETIGYATYISPQAVLCSLDIISRDINFRVSNDGLKFSLETVAIVVASNIEIFRIEPTFVSSHYGTYVTLFGNRIPVDPLCVFQGAIFPSFESNSSICVCLVNPDGLPGNFSLGLFDGASSHSRHFYIVALDSSISAIVPSQVPKSFVSTLRVEGLHALPDLEWNCMILNGSQSFNFFFDTKSSSCMVSLPIAGAFVLHVSSGSFRTNSVQLLSHQTIFITRVSPSIFSSHSNSSLLEIYTSSDVSALTNLECKLGFFVIVDAFVGSKNMIACQFASLKLYGNVSVEILYGGFVFSNSFVIQVVDFASVTSVSKRIIGTDG